MGRSLAEIIQSLPKQRQKAILKRTQRLAMNVKSSEQLDAESCMNKDRKESGQSLLFDSIIRDMDAEGLSDLPPDGAEQHDHYIYQTPKKCQ